MESRRGVDHHQFGARRPRFGKIVGDPDSETDSFNEIDDEVFIKRLKVLYSHWDEHRSNLWCSSEVVAIATPPASKKVPQFWTCKSIALTKWLFGCGVRQTIIVFMKKQIHFLCSRKVISFLKVVKKSAKEAVGVDVVMHERAVNDVGSALMDAIILAIRDQSKADGHDTAVIGRNLKELVEGPVMETWYKKVKLFFEFADVTNGLSDLFAIKDDQGIQFVKNAAFLTGSVMNTFVVPKLEEVMFKKKKVTHSALRDETEKAIKQPSEAGVNFVVENVHICCPPAFQSGGKFDIRPSARRSNDELLSYDSAGVIICAFGSCYKYYCSYIARSFLIDATSSQIKAYEVLLKAHDSAISELKPGKKVSAAYQAALAVVKKEAPEYESNLTKSAGTGIGLEFCESVLNINAKNERLVKAGMVFNVTLGFRNLQSGRSNPKNQNFDLLIADTLVINNDKPEVVTSESSKALKDVAYYLNDGDEDEAEA